MCCIKSFVSKRKKRGYEVRGLVRFLGNYTMEDEESEETPDPISPPFNQNGMSILHEGLE